MNLCIYISYIYIYIYVDWHRKFWVEDCAANGRA